VGSETRISQLVFLSRKSGVNLSFPLGNTTSDFNGTIFPTGKLINVIIKYDSALRLCVHWFYTTQYNQHVIYFTLITSDWFSCVLLLQSTGAVIQVANEMLPGSTERAVTISGSSDAITPCIRRLCAIAIEVIRE